MQEVKFIQIQVTPEQLQEAIIEGVKTQIDELKKSFKPREPIEFLSRQDVAEMFNIHLSSVINWEKKGLIIAYQISGRIFYKRSELEDAIVKLKH